jgi:hypothetical protein
MTIKHRQVWVVSFERGQALLCQTTETETPDGCTVRHLRPAQVRFIIASGAKRSDVMRTLKAVDEMELDGIAGPERSDYQP